MANQIWVAPRATHITGERTEHQVDGHTLIIHHGVNYDAALSAMRAQVQLWERERLVFPIDTEFHAGWAG